jgi:hypothetical protein
MQISNGYIRKRDNPVSVTTKDILSIDRQKLRVKRFLVIGLTLFGLLCVAYTAFGYAERGMSALNTYNAALSGDEQAKIDVWFAMFGHDLFLDEIVSEFGEDMIFVLEAAGYALDEYNRYVLLESILDGSYIVNKYLPKNLYEVIKYAVFAVLFIGSVIFVGKYITKTYKVLRIKALGGDFAVEVQHYDGGEIDKLIKAYYARN